MLNLNKPTYPTTYIIRIIFSLVEYKQKQLFQIYNKKSSEQKTVERFQSLSVLSSIRIALSTQLYNYNTHRYIYAYTNTYQRQIQIIKRVSTKKKRENNTGVAYRNIISKTYLELINKNT